MATISSLTDGGALQGTDTIPVARLSSGALTNVKITGANLVNVDNTKGLVKDTSTGNLSIKLQSGGGLEFNAVGELKLSPAASTSTIVVVRPSDSAATDNWVTRAVVAGELRPCFKTLIQATGWARYNLTGNVTIYVDEDTIEGSAEILPGFNGPNINARYYSQAQVDTAFGAGSGLRAGIYVHAANTANPISGNLWWHGGIGSNTTSSTTTIIARYLRGASWQTNRLFTDPPRNINYNVYISNNKALAVGSLGTNSSNWSSLVGWGTSDNGPLYVRSAAAIVNSKQEIVNINFVSRTNARDIDFMSVYSNSIVTLRNTSFTILGSGYYNYSALRVTDGSTVTVQHRVLTSPVTNTDTYPGYGVAFIGNKNGARDRTTATKTSHLIEIINNGWLRVMDWDPFKSNDSYLSTSIILDGDFIINSSAVIKNDTSKMELLIAFVNNDSRFMDDRFSFSGVNNTLSWTSTTNSTYPIYFTKLTDTRIWGWGQPLRKWTIDRSIDNTGTAARSFPVKINTANMNVGIGQFNSSQNTFTYTATDERYAASMQDFNATNHTVGGVNLYAPDLAVGALTQIPQFNNFYTISESGTNRNLNYGTSVR